MLANRRDLILAVTVCAALPRSVHAEAADGKNHAFAALETKHGGRLGVAVLDSGATLIAGHRDDQRFPMCSTFKLLATAVVLHRVDLGQESLDRRVRFSEADLVEYSPFAKTRASGQGATLGELCKAAMTLSDNTAANLLLQTFGGPAALTAFARSLGDPVTRLDRIETAMSEAAPGDPRDTTTPKAMARDVQALVLGEVLSAGSRRLLCDWLKANQTGDQRLRAGFPSSWVVGDKTGSGNNGTTNDVAIIWLENRKALIVAAYLTGCPAGPDERNGVLAEVGRLVASITSQPRGVGEG
ncbi:MAG TPA: class A beta-lactamase [Burkholderiaceae bacterium]|nr:class A beta-lactamase [Burkholderiaceae bacterium]